MFNFSKPLTALAFLTLMTTGAAMPSAANAVTPA
ncbi:hypothetical protein CAL7102_05649 [Dulcicalothrix desertica PCC 7102]|nr:hypothetical protein CAL7102_05649 [Dulcicalothrix desertica PCC 7102]